MTYFHDWDHAIDIQYERICNLLDVPDIHIAHDDPRIYMETLCYKTLRNKKYLYSCFYYQKL